MIDDMNVDRLEALASTLNAISGAKHEDLISREQACKIAMLAAAKIELILEDEIIGGF